MDIKNLALRPNCLITRSAFVFLSGPRSLFSSQKMGKPVQDYIEAHGYQIQALWLPFHSKYQRQQSLKKWLKKNQTKSFHFILADETWREFKNLLQIENLHPHSTLTLIQLEPDLNNPLKSVFDATRLHTFVVSAINKTQIPLSYRIHQQYCSLIGLQALTYEKTLAQENKIICDRFLDHCIELAENEFKDLTSRM